MLIGRIFALGFLTLVGSQPAAPAGLDATSHVFVIVMENHNWSTIKGNSSAPYINNVLLPMASYCDQYYNPPGIHPSEPNYLWLEAGTNFGITNDNPPSVNHQSTTAHLVAQLKNAGISWKTYQENIDGTTCPVSDSYPYAAKHNPFVFFDDVVNSSSPPCTTLVRPFTELANDLNRNTVAHYNFVTPNLCNDMHDSCSPTNNPVKQGDSWLAANIPTVLNSNAYQNNGLIIITWDEGAGATSDGPIGFIVLSPLAKGGGYHNAIEYTHSATLRTLQKIFGVRPVLGGAATEQDVSDLFVDGAIPNPDLNTLEFSSVVWQSNGRCTVTWTSEVGTAYRVQSKNSITDQMWQSIAPDFTGTGAMLNWTDDGSKTGGLSRQRFYRVEIP
jgi:hypothetical protein